MSNLITFTYTKADGKKSLRVIYPLVRPSTGYEGIDLSELDTEEQVAFANLASKLRDEYLLKLNTLQNEFDVNGKYRKFDATKMTDIVKEFV